MGTSPATDSVRATKSPKQTKASSPPRQDNSAAPESSTTNAETTTKPLAPPPRPGQQNGENTPDYFTSQLGGGLLSLEPNPFEQSFGGGAAPETPGGTKLPPVTALTSPSSLLPGTGVTPFNWGGGSLRTGPLSPAMLSGPTTDYFSDNHHIRGGFPTPNESSLRTGLTPGGSGSMFPAPSPSSAALFASLGSAGATPTTIDFHRTALSAAAKRNNEQNQAASSQRQHGQSGVTSNPQELTNGNNGNAATNSGGSTTSGVKAEPKTAPGPFDPHDNDAANGLFLLAQGRSAPPSGPTVTSTAPPVEPPPPPAVAPATTTATSAAPFSASPEMGVASVNGNNNNNSSSMVNGTSRGGRVAAPPAPPASDAGSGMSEEADHHQSSTPSRPNTRGRGKRTSTQAGLAPNGRGGAAAMNSKAAAPIVDDRKSPPKKKAKAAQSAPAPPVSNDDEDDYDSEDDGMKGEKNADGSNKKMTDEEKRKNFLERNRVAALKCRQRKKQWLQSLQQKVEMYSTENDNLTSQITQLREEVVNLKTLLLAHKDCPVSQQQGLHQAYMQQPAAVDPFGQQLNPYQMAAPMAPQGIIAGQGVNRRYS